MKKRKTAVFVLVAVMLAISGCQKQEEPQKAPEPEVSSAQEQKETQETATVMKGETESEEQSIEQTVIKVYSCNEEATAFETEEIAIEALSAEAVIAVLTERGVLPADVKVLSFAVKEAEQKQSIEVDLNSAYLTYVNNMGSTGEYYAVGCLVNTFLDAYRCGQIKVTVEGNPLETGHAAYHGYLMKFE